MIKAALICCFVYWVTNVINKVLLLNIAWSPIVVCPLMGLLLGDAKTGLIMGGMLQAIFLGVIGIGGVMPANKQLGSIIPCAYVLVGGLDIETGLAIAYTIGVLTNQLNRLFTPMFAATEPYWKKLASEANSKKYNAFYWFYFLFISMTPAMLIIFFAVAFGTDAVSNLVALLPAKLLSGLNASSNMMPAVGIGIALTLTWSKAYGGFFFIGWIFAYVLGLSAMQCAILAISVGVIWFFVTAEADKNKPAQVKNQGGDFF